MIKYDTYENDKSGISTIVLPIICLSEFSIFSLEVKQGYQRQDLNSDFGPILMDHEFRK
jgi:hypothetical protein